MNRKTAIGPLLARLAHLSVIEPSVHRTVGREDLLSVCGVYAQPHSTGTIQACIHAAERYLGSAPTDRRTKGIAPNHPGFGD